MRQVCRGDFVEFRQEERSVVCRAIEAVSKVLQSWFARVEFAKCSDGKGKGAEAVMSVNAVEAGRVISQRAVEAGKAF